MKYDYNYKKNEKYIFFNKRNKFINDICNIYFWLLLICLWICFFSYFIYSTIYLIVMIFIGFIWIYYTIVIYFLEHNDRLERIQADITYLKKHVQQTHKKAADVSKRRMHRPK